jgi:peroxiredoxin
LEIVGVSTSPADSVEAIRDFQKDLKQEYTVVRGEKGVDEKFGNGPGLPITYLIDRDGRIRLTVIGARDRAGWEAAVKPLLAEVQATAQKTN